MKIPRNHPYWHIKSVVEQLEEICALNFSYYIYRPESIIDERIAVVVDREDFLSERYVSHMLGQEHAGYELSIHSNVQLEGGGIKHIPMVDMSTASRAHLAKIRPFVGEDFFDEIVWFASGRSFHGYGARLLDEKGWAKFLGALLLSNKKDMRPTVDPRWIGHRLMAGYSALRWTKWTSAYITSPTQLTPIPGDATGRGSTNSP